VGWRGEGRRGEERRGEERIESANKVWYVCDWEGN
jgi:hypothetical protein